MYPELWNWIQILFFAAFTCLPPTPHPSIHPSIIFAELFLSAYKHALLSHFKTTEKKYPSEDLAYRALCFTAKALRSVLRMLFPLLIVSSSKTLHKLVLASSIILTLLRSQIAFVWLNSMANFVLTFHNFWATSTQPDN